MDTSQLLDLIELDRLGSFSRAAAQRCLSVSAISRRIRLLEDWAGQPLVDRAAHPLRLTAAGRELLDVARLVCGELERARLRLRGRGATEVTRFLVPTSVSLSLVPRLIARLQQALGALPLHFSPHNQADAMQRFHQGEAEFVLYYDCEAYLPRTPPTRARALVIAHDTLIPVARDAQAAGGGGRPWRVAMLDDSSYLGQLARAAMLRHRLDFEAGVTGSQILATRELALEGLGLAWQPWSLVAEFLAAGRLQRVLPALPALPLRVWAARPEHALHADHEAIWSALERISEDGGLLKPAD